MAGEGGGGILRELIAVFSFGVETDGLKQGENKLEEFFGKVEKGIHAFLGLFAVHEIAEFAEANVRAMEQVEHAADRLGISADQVQAYQFAAKSLGMEGETLLNMMGRLQIAQQAAAEGSKQQAGAFKKLGVDVRDSNHEFKDASTLFLDVADGIAKTKNPSVQAALAVKLFGRQGRELLPILKKGRAGLDEFLVAYDKLGGGYSEKAIEASKEYTKENAKLDLAFKGLKSTILVALLPVMGAIIRILTSAVVWLREMTKQSEIVKATLIVLGAAAGAFAIKLAIDFAPVLLVAAALAALALIVDDLLVMFEGGDSATGALIDKLFGKDAHLDAVIALRDAWHAIMGAIKTSFEYLIKFGDLLGDVAARLENTFGASGQKAQVEIAANRIAGEIKAQRTTRETHYKSTEKLEREVLGQAPTGPEVPFGPESPAGAAYTPLNFAPLTSQPPPTNARGESVTIGDVTINAYPAPGMDEKKYAEHTAAIFNKMRKQERRAAKATLQTVPAQK